MNQCPNCHSAMRGEPIADKHFVHLLQSDPTWDRKINISHEQQVEEWGRCHCLPYGERPAEERFYSRCLGEEVRGIYDGILIWHCPDCGHSWPRFSPDPANGYDRLHKVALEIISGRIADKERETSGAAHSAPPDHRL